MVVQEDIIEDIKTSALAAFDSTTHIGFGTGTTPPSPSDTDLTTPIIRKAFDETPIKNVVAGTYDFSANLGLTEGNGNTFGETGLFDAVSSGNMYIKKLLTNLVPKTSAVELSIGLRVNVEVTNT